MGYVLPFSRYLDIVARLEPIVERTPRWRILIHLTAEAAENGRDLSKAHDLYRRKLALLDPTRDAEDYNALSDKIKGLAAKITPTPPVVAAAAGVAATAGVMPTWPLNLLKVPSGAAMTTRPRVAVLGGTPLEETLKSLDFEIIKSSESAPPGDEALREHTSAAVEAFQIVAPQAHFIFAAAPSTADRNQVFEAEIVRLLNEIMAAKPDVVLIPLRIGQLTAVAKTVAQLARTTVIVIAAGNEGPGSPVQFGKEGLLDDLMSVGSVGPNGLASDFSSKSDKAYWAPGENIPIRRVMDGRVTSQTMSGTTFSAALAAGVVARVLDKKPGMKPNEILQLLRETSAPAAPGGPPVLNLHDALNRLK